MSTQVLQLNQTKGRFVANKSEVVPAAQGEDCASSPTGIRFIARVNPLEIFNTAHGKHNSTFSVRYALVQMIEKGDEKIIVPCEGNTRRKSLSMAVRRVGKRLGIEIVTRAIGKELHIYNATKVLAKFKQ